MSTDKLIEKWQSNQKWCIGFNGPDLTMVAINCAHIGDDNDYSCFLHNAVFALWKAGEKETAYCLFLTDPALVDFKDKAEFEKEMNRLKMIRDEEQENQRAYYKKNRPDM